MSIYTFRPERRSSVSLDDLHESPLVLKDFVKAIRAVRPTVTLEDVKKQDEFAQEAGKSIPSIFMYSNFDISMHTGSD